MTIEDYNEIEEVLAEANAYGLKKEVEQLANEIESLGILRVDAIQQAFNTLIK